MTVQQPPPEKTDEYINLYPPSASDHYKPVHFCNLWKEFGIQYILDIEMVNFDTVDSESYLYVLYHADVARSVGHAGMPPIARLAIL